MSQAKANSVNYTQGQLYRIPRLHKLVADEELDLLDFLTGSTDMIHMTQAVWFRNYSGFSELHIEAFRQRWVHPSGQYKNYAVVLQTLMLVPMNERANSHGAILGAKAMTGSGEWLKFLPFALKELGFSGIVDLWDVGLTDSVQEYEGLTLNMYSAYYVGKGPFTWMVNDVYDMGPGSVDLIAKYCSFKDFGTDTPFFSDTEGRKFYQNRVPVKPEWPWLVGRCPCDRCCIESALPLSVADTLQWFDTRCRPGIWKWAPRIMEFLDKNMAYKPVNRTEQAAAIIQGASLGFRSGPGIIAPETGQIVLSGTDLVGEPFVDHPIVTSVQQHHLEGKGVDYHTVYPVLRTPVVKNIAAELYYMPEGDYPDFEATSQISDGYLGYKKRTLPMDPLKDEGKKFKYIDKYGRKFFWYRAPKPDEMWCWREKKLVPTNHLCADLDPVNRTREHRGWKTHFSHVVKTSSKDLCPQCDRLISTYFHICPKGWIIEKPPNSLNLKDKLCRSLRTLSAGRSDYELDESYKYLFDGYYLVPYEEKPDVSIPKKSKVFLDLRDFSDQITRARDRHVS